MPAQAKVNLVVLWEHEIRIAAKACAALRRVYEDEDSTVDARHQALQTLVTAAGVALHSADADDATLVLASEGVMLKHAAEATKKQRPNKKG